MNSLAGNRLVDVGRATAPLTRYFVALRSAYPQGEAEQTKIQQMEPDITFLALLDISAESKHQACSVAIRSFLSLNPHPGTPIIADAQTANF